MTPTYVSYPGSRDGDGQTVSVYVGDVMVAGATCLRRRYDPIDPDRMAWHLVPVLRLPGVGELRSFEARDEQDARAWLGFVATLYCAAVIDQGVSADVVAAGR